MNDETRTKVREAARDLKCVSLGLKGRDTGSMGDRAHLVLEALIERLAEWIQANGRQPSILVTSVDDIAKYSRELVGREFEVGKLEKDAGQWRVASGRMVPPEGDQADGVVFRIEGGNSNLRIWFEVIEAGKRVYGASPGSGDHVTLASIMTTRRDWTAVAAAMLRDAERGDKHANEAVQQIKRAQIVLLVLLVAALFALTPIGQDLLHAADSFVRELLGLPQRSAPAGESLTVSGSRVSSALRIVGLASQSPVLRAAMPIGDRVEVWDLHGSQVTKVASIQCTNPLDVAILDDLVFVAEGLSGWSVTGVGEHGIVMPPVRYDEGVEVTAIAVDPDGKLLYLGSADGRVQSFEAPHAPESRTKLSELQLVGCPVSIEVDNRRILVGTKAREGFGAGITVLVNNENAILELAALVVDGSTSRFAQYRSWVYQPQPSGLGIYALEDSNIVGRGFVTELSQLRGVRATRVGVLIAAREDELVILDISDPTRPKVQSTTKAADAASYLAMDVVSR